MILNKALRVLLLLLSVSMVGITQAQEDVAQWSVHEIELEADQTYENAYVDVDVWATFTNDAGQVLKRPGFWDGNQTWKIRFTPPDASANWTWITEASVPADNGLHGRKGNFRSIAHENAGAFRSQGLLKISPGHRSLVRQSGAPFLMIADTAWSIPFRATSEQVEIYAQDRHSKGFNTCFLSIVQPDRKAEGPDALNTEQGFTRAFLDLKDGHINRLNPAYFQTLDNTTNILLNHEIVPMYAVMLHGYGWKGMDVIGNSLDPKEYVRFCKYLLARYGASPAIWLLTVDGAGKAPGIEDGGKMLEHWDCYSQPTGIHYNPFDEVIATWAKDLPDPTKYCLHGNKTHQDAPWLDFQWAQTGHDGKHVYHKVEKMYDNLPTKAVADAESTYEGMNEGKLGLGWWQGEDAWMQLMSGGTMGVAYGACSIWRWKITADETGWESWTEHAMSWRDSLDLEGSHYVGLIGKMLAPYDLTDIQRRWDLADGKPLLAQPGKLYIAYLNNGGEIRIKDTPSGATSHWINPRTGQALPKQQYNGQTLSAPSSEPWVLVITH